MSFEKYLRQKKIEKEATEAASKSVNEVLSISYMRSEFEKLPEISEILDKNGGGYYREMIEDYHHSYPYFEKFLNGAWLTWQHQQSKVDDLQKKNAWLSDVAERENKRANKLQEENVNTKVLLGKTIQEKNELQKRVDELEFQLKHWKQKSMPAMLNGMCGHCGKEPLQGIVSDKEDYALLHCFGCGANKYEWIGEQSLKGDY